MEKYIGFVIVLFFLSMICERVADFLKHYLSEVNTGLAYYIKKLLRIGNLLTKGKVDGIQEEKRYYRILKINIWCGFFTAFALHADLFTIIKHIDDDPFNALGWQDIVWPWDVEGWELVMLFWGWLMFIVGCFATGCFISFGSKFWHDLLDTLFEIKNYRRLLADPDTFKVDNIAAFDKLTKTYESEIFLGAYKAAKEQWKGIEAIIATAFKHDDAGYYIEVTLTSDTDRIQGFFEYSMDDGQIKNVRVVKVITADEIVVQSNNLSDFIFNKQTPAIKGTVGCLVKVKNRKEPVLLTCFHNVADKNSGFTFNANGSNIVTLDNGQTPVDGQTIHGQRDHEIDAALIALDKTVLSGFVNQIPGLGEIKGVRDNLKKRDLQNNIGVALNGAISHTQMGVLKGLYCDVKAKYSDGRHELINLIAISNNNKAVSKPGDSGACVVDADRKLVGIIVAADSSTSYAIPATTIFNKLSLELFTS